MRRIADATRARAWAFPGAPGILLLLALGPSTSASARAAEIADQAIAPDFISIDGVWKYHRGDVEDAAAADYDDARWPTMSLPQARASYYQLHRQPIAWFRRVVELPEPLRRGEGPLGLALGPITGAAEIYVNGQRVGQRGKLPPSPHDSLEYESVHLIPRALIPADGRLQLALRTWQSDRQRAPWSGTTVRLWPGTNIIGPPSTVLAKAEYARLVGRLPAIIGIVLGFALWLVGFNYFSIYRKRREQRAFFCFSVFCFGIGAYAVVINRIVAFEILHLETVSSHCIGTAILCFATILLIEFTNHFLFARPPGRLLRGYQIVCAAGALIGLLPHPWCYLFGAYPTGSLYVLCGLALCCPSLFRSAWRGSNDIRLLAAGYLFTLVSIGWATGMALLSEKQPGLARVLSLTSPILLTAVMARSLSGQFVHTLNSLDAAHRATRRFVPIEYLQLLGKTDLTEIKLGDHVELQLAVLFFDIRDFTALSEKLGPRDTFAFINELQGYIEPVIHDHGGVISAHLGDGVMALFLLPADQVLAAVVGMHRALSRYNDARLRRGDALLRTGIGVHSGVAILGTVGSEPRQSLTLLSDTVNLASRIEGMNKALGTAALISANAVAELRDHAAHQLRPVGRITAKGKSEPTTVYEVLDILSPEQRALRQKTQPSFAAALDSFQKGELSLARERLLEVRAVDSDDGPAAMYLARCEEYARDGLPADWDGSVQLMHK